MKLYTFLFVIISAITPIYCIADDDDDDDENFIIIGASVQAETEIYKDIDSKNEINPLLMIKYGPFSLIQEELAYEFYDKGIYSFSVFIDLPLGGSGYDSSDAKSDSQLYDGLEGTDAATEVGVSVEIDLDVVDLGFSYASDTSGTHEGNIFQVSVSKDYPLGNGDFILRPAINISHVSEEYNQYYYGVTSSQASPERSEYKADNFTNFEAEILGIYKIGNFLIFSQLGLEQYDSSIKGSPLVEDSQSTSYTLGIGYEF